MKTLFKIKSSHPDIFLNNRYNASHHLIYIDDKHYRLKSAEDWMPISLIGEADDYKAVDPEGGPCLYVGDTIEGKIIKAIYEENGNIIIEFV